VCMCSSQSIDLLSDVKTALKTSGPINMTVMLLVHDEDDDGVLLGHQQLDPTVPLRVIKCSYSTSWTGLTSCTGGDSETHRYSGHEIT